MIAISSVFGRNKVKYGERGYRYSLIDRGHLGQNIYLVSTLLKLNCCAIGGYVDGKINKLLDVDGTEESVVALHAMGIP